jgi:hypothetical protein
MAFPAVSPAPWLRPGSTCFPAIGFGRIEHAAEASSSPAQARMNSGRGSTLIFSDAFATA